MGNNKTKAFVLIGLGIAIVVCLHMFVFAPLKANLQQGKAEMERLQSQYRQIVSTINTEGSGGDLSSQQAIVVQMEQVLDAINSKIESDKQSFARLDQQMKIVEHFDPSKNYEAEVISEIHRIRNLEQNSPVTSLRVSNSWGVNEPIAAGRFGGGFHAHDRLAMAYYNNTTTKRVINPRQGTIEFYVKPDWDPTDTEVHHKSLFMAIHTERMSRERLTQMAEGQTDEYGRPINLNQILPPGPGPYPVDSMIAIYKGEGPTLTFELKDFIKAPSTLTAYINDWKPGQWYHVAAIWEEKRQALYINGQNKGIPFGGGTSIRSARDVEDEGLLLGGGGGMGMMGMGMMGMGMGMGMMGMGGFGMGGMGMGMMGGAGARSFGSTTGQTLTQNIAIPTILTGIYVGTDDEGSFSADCTFDDLRILDGVSTSFSINRELPQTDKTLLLDHFEDDLPDPEDLPVLLSEIESKQRSKHITTTPEIQERIQKDYLLLKHALGLNTNYYNEVDPTRTAIRQLWVMEYIRQNTGTNFPILLQYFEIDPKSLANDLLYRITEFQKLCYDLAQSAVENKVISINNVINKGQSYNVNDQELMSYFNSRRQTLSADIVGPDSLLIQHGGGGGYGMGMGMMGGYGMGFGMGMMGGYGMGMGMMGGMGGSGSLGNPAMWVGRLFDPDTGEDLTKLQIEELFKEIDQKTEQLKTWNKYYLDGLVPPEVITMYNKDMEAQGEDYYIKRALELDLDADYRAAMQYFYDIEYGNRFNTINKITINHNEEDVVNCIIDVESHYLDTVPEEVEDEGVATQTTASAGPIGLN
jgi:hypothetical protein